MNEIDFNTLVKLQVLMEKALAILEEEDINNLNIFVAKPNGYSSARMVFKDQSIAVQRNSVDEPYKVITERRNNDV